MNRALLEQAISTIGYYASVCGEDDQDTPAKQTIEALMQELAKDEPKPVAWNVRNGLVGIAVFRYQEVAEAFATQKQKEHDLTGSLAAFKVEPLYTKGTTNV